MLLMLLLLMLLMLRESLFSYLHFAAATSFCLVVRTSILKNRFNKLFQLVKKTFSAKESSPQKNSLEKKYLKMKKRHQTVSRNWLSQWKKTHKATFFTSTHDAFFQDGQILLNLINSVPTRNRVFVVVGRDRHRPSLQPFLFFVSANSFFRSNSSNHESDESPFDQNSFRPKSFYFNFFAEIFHFFSEDENGTETETLGIKNKNLIRWSTRRRRR